MIVDAFPFFREFDLLELRLAVMDPIVDRFVIAEGSRTYSGAPKPMWFAENRERYAKWQHKIRYVPVDDWPESDDPWIIENHQRNALVRGFEDLPDDAQIVHSDLDEIPNPEAVMRAAGRPGVNWLSMRNCRMFMNATSVNKPLWMGGAKTLTYGEFKRSANLPRFKYCKFAPRECNSGVSAVKVRRMKDSALIRDGGWHFSFLGGIEEITRKIQAYSHQERNTAEFLDPQRLGRLLAEGYTVNGARLLIRPVEELGLPPVAMDFVRSHPQFVAPPQEGDVRRDLERLARRNELKQRLSRVYLYRQMRGAFAAMGVRLPAFR